MRNIIIKCWTIQSQDAWNDLNKNGIYYAKKDIVETNEAYLLLERGYNFIIQHMESQGLKRPPNVDYPIWAWLRRYKCKPRRREERKEIPKGQKMVLIEFEISDETVVLTDFIRYSHCSITGICLFLMLIICNSYKS